jgi:hypothetical protein
MATIYPKFGQEQQTAIDLLALVDDPREVGTNTDDGFAFVVSDEVYERYVNGQAPVEQTPAMVEQSKRRPGRPRKVVSEKEGE